jgi:hypothetical protein
VILLEFQRFWYWWWHLDGALLCAYGTVQVLSPVTVFWWEFRALSAVLMSSPIMPMWLSHCFCIRILGTTCWQMHGIFKTLLQMVWKLPTEIPTLSTTWWPSEHIIFCTCHTVLVL